MFFIAELGLNAHGDFEKMRRMAHKALEAGATHIKGQFYNPYRVLGKDHPALNYALQCQFTRQQHEQLAKEFPNYFVSVFNVGDIGWADSFCKVHKVASRMNRNQEFIAKLEACKKPTLMSVQPECQGIRIPDRFKLMWCVREYPTPLEEIKKYTYNKNFGLSSHCPSPEALKYALSKGAEVIEAHVCESREEEGCDISSSLTFEEFQNAISTGKFHGSTVSKVPTSLGAIKDS